MSLDNLVLYENIGQVVTLSGVAQKKGRKPTQDDLGIVKDAALVADNQTNEIVWVGPGSDLPGDYDSIVNRFSSEGEIWIPELIESHTHFLFGGTRHHDYAERCRGKTYQEIAAQGGGILTTMKHTREIPMEDLLKHGLEELEKFQNYGIGVIEVKTGYGLTLESELKVLNCVQLLQQQTSVALIPTFLPAHATPPEFKGRTDEYVEVICKEWIPEIAGNKLAKFFDVFIEQGYFDVKQAEKMCITAKEAGMELKLHVDQFNDIGGTELAIELGAKSVDHLDQLSDANVERLANSDTVATLLPGASFFTGTPYPPARKLIDAGAKVALSTDYNPGTCPSRNLPLMTTFACSQMSMTPEEALAGITYNAAASLGLEDQIGSLEAGKQFRVCHLHGDSYEVLPYCFGELG